MNALPSTKCPLVPVESEPAPPMQPPPLDTDSVALLARLERQLGSAKTPLSTTALALATIKNRGLARLHGLTFPQYCAQRLRIRRSRIYQLLEHADLLEATTAASGSLHEAANERQLRPLKKLARADWAAAWAEAVRTAPQGKITGKHVQFVVEARLAMLQAAQVPASAPAVDQQPPQPITPIPPPAVQDTGTSVPSTTPTPGEGSFVRTVPPPNVDLPGWKPEWARMIRSASRPPGALSSSVFGYQAPD